MSRSSNSDLEKETGLEKEVSRSPVSEEEEDIIEASQPPFTTYEDPEKQSVRATEEPNGAPLENVDSKPSVNNIKSVPNGGTKAWLQVLGVFFVFFNTWGIVNAFGIYQNYYETGILSGSDPSDISWIGSVEAFLLMLVGSIAGPIYDKGYAHQLLLLGSFLIVFGQMMLSLCSSYYQVFLAQGISIGVGTGCIFVSGVAILSTYFSTKLATATGIAASGSSIGGMLYPIIFYKLQPQIGFAWATRVLGFIAFSTLAVSNIVLRVRVLPAARRKFFEFVAWKEMPYTFFNLGSFFAFFGLYVPFFYIQLFAIQEEIMGPELAFYVLAVLNAASTFGRIIPNYIADRVGPLNVILPCALVCGILQYCLIVARTTAGVMILVTFYGFFSGTLVSLPATIFVHLAGPKNRGRIGTRMGMGFAFVSTGMLVGTPITGQILQAYGFNAIWVYGGTFMCVGSVFLMLSRFTQARVVYGGWPVWVKV